MPETFPPARRVVIRSVVIDCRTVPEFAFALHMSPYSGGYSGGVPPLPIPNREVKPARADGTAHPWESR